MYEHADPVIDFTGQDSLARQEFRDEADINNIIKKYQVTGFLVDPSTPRVRRPTFGDFASLPDYQQSLNIVLQAQDRFDALPVEIRHRFNYDPANLLAFVSDSSNRDEAIKLGLIDENPTKSASALEARVAEPAPPAPPSSTANGVPEA